MAKTATGEFSVVPHDLGSSGFDDLAVTKTKTATKVANTKTKVAKKDGEYAPMGDYMRPFSSLLISFRRS